MRKIVFLGVLLFMAVPAMAGVVMSCSDDDVNKITISYDANGGTLIRAFGLDITTDPTNIIGVEVLDPNYRIYPGQIVIEDGVVTDYNNPYAAGDIGDLTLTIEMGSLYADDDPDFNHPPAGSGDLIAIIVDSGPDDVNYTVDVNTLRGGIVLEDPDEDPCTIGLPCGGTIVRECYTGPEPTEWADVGKPQCWCANVQPRQCHGDADNAAQGKQNYWVSTYDADVVFEAWNKPYGQLVDGNGVHLTLSVGGKDVPLICADFDHLSQGKQNYRVSTDDLDILYNVSNWQVSGKPDPNCP